MPSFLRKQAVVLILLAGLSACSESGKKVTKAEYGEKWPFTVDEGYLDCRGNHEVVFKVGRKTYALSGEASVSEKYLDVNPIWRDDPQMKGTKVLLSPLVEAGAKLCK